MPTLADYSTALWIKKQSTRTWTHCCTLFMRKPTAIKEVANKRQTVGVTSNMEQSGFTWPRKARQLLWPTLRAVLIVYLLVVLVMMLFETRLVYPIPPANASDWHPTGFKYEDVSFESADGTKLHGWFVAHP